MPPPIPSLSPLGAAAKPPARRVEFLDDRAAHSPDVFTAQRPVPAASTRGQRAELVHRQAAVQQWIIRRFMAEGRARNELAELVALHRKMAALDAQALDASVARPGLRRDSPSTLAQAFCKEAARLCGPHPTDALALGIEELRRGALQLRRQLVDRVERRVAVDQLPMRAAAHVLRVRSEIGIFAQDTAVDLFEVGHAAAEIPEGVAEITRHAAEAAEATADTAEAVGEMSHAAASGTAHAASAAPIVGVAVNAIKLPGLVVRLYGDVQDVKQAGQSLRALEGLRGRISADCFASLVEHARLNLRLHRQQLAARSTETVATAGSVALAAASLGAAPAVVTAPLSVLAAATAITSRSAGKVVSHRMNAQSGSHASDRAHATERLDCRALIDRYGVEETLQIAAEIYSLHQAQWARHKLNSLELRMLRSEGARSATAQDRAERLARMLDSERSHPGASGVFHRTTARAEDIKLMRQMLADDIDAGVFEGSVAQVTERIHDATLSSVYAYLLKQDHEDEIQAQFLRLLRRSPDQLVKAYVQLARTGHATKADTWRLIAQRPDVEGLWNRATLRVLTPLLKADSALFRTHDAQHLALLSALPARDREEEPAALDREPTIVSVRL